jgi:hypothetical protein
METEQAETLPVRDILAVLDWSPCSEEMLKKVHTGCMELTCFEEKKP